MQNIIFIFNSYLIITHLTYDCLTQLKQALQIQENICIKNKSEEKFFSPLYI